MTSVRPAPNTEAATWLLEGDVDWWTLVRYGPAGFECYVRVALPPVNAPSVADPVSTALKALAMRTATPATCHAAIWEGWTSGVRSPVAPVVPIPNRTMRLFECHIDDLRDAPALAWSLATTPGVGFPPHLAWPDDRAWCFACEVDEEIEFTVACSMSTAEALSAALPGATRISAYGAPAPTYRNRN